MREPVATRREFELMLEKGRLRGDEEDMETAGEAFREALQPLAAERTQLTSKVRHPDLAIVDDEAMAGGLGGFVDPPSSTKTDRVSERGGSA